MTFWLALYLVQDPQAIRAAMESSLQQQRTSTSRQLAAARPAAIPLPTSAPAASCNPIDAPKLASMIDDSAQRQGISPALVREVVRQESGFSPCATSPKGAQGLMQLMPSTQAQFQVQNPFDPQESLDAGSRLLKQLLERYGGDLRLALSAYNAGPSAVDRSGGVPPIPETRNYVGTILQRLGP